MQKFSAEDVLGIAIRIEKNAQEYYRRASEIVTDLKAKTVLKDLALWEVKHETIFRNLQHELKALQINSSGVIPDAAGYLAAVADGAIFNTSVIDHKLRNLPNDAHTILIEALNYEKDSVVFFTMLKNMIPNESGKATISNVINEEVSHIVYIMKKTDELFEKKK